MDLHHCIGNDLSKRLLPLAHEPLDRDVPCLGATNWQPHGSSLALCAGKRASDCCLPDGQRIEHAYTPDASFICLGLAKAILLATWALL